MTNRPVITLRGVARARGHEHTLAPDVESWRFRAKCRDADPDLFFQSDPRPALEWCEFCPVKAACLNEALLSGDMDYGVRGGLTPEQRRVVKRRRLEADRAALRSAEDERRRLYEQGLTDKQIGELVGTTRNAISSWRHDRGLPVNPGRKTTRDRGPAT